MSETKIEKVETAEVVEETPVEETVPAYTFRKLTAKDIFPMCSLISRFGVSEFKKAFDPEMISQLVDDKGEVSMDKLSSIVGINIVFDMAGIIMENLPKCESQVFSFLASVSDKKPEEIENMSPADFASMVIDFVKKEEFKDFFKAVSKLLK